MKIPRINLARETVLRGGARSEIRPGKTLSHCSFSDLPQYLQKYSPCLLPNFPFLCTYVDCVWNVMAHAQKPDFVFRAKRTSPFKSAGEGRQFIRLLAAEMCGISGSNVGYTMFRGSVKGTGYPLHSPVSSSLPLPCVTVCHHVSTGLYQSP